MRAPARCVRADVSQDGQEGRGYAATGLGSDGDLLLTSARALAARTDDDHRGVALLFGAPAHGRLSPVQARGGRHGDHLENAPSRRDVVEKTECAGAVAAGGLWHDVHGRDHAEVRTR